MHTTVLYVGGKYNQNVELYVKHIDKECKMVITGHGISNKAMALKVKSIKFKNTDIDVKSFSAQQHITVALSKDTKAVDSIKTLLGEGIVTIYPEPFIVYGKLTIYIYMKNQLKIIMNLNFKFFITIYTYFI